MSSKRVAALSAAAALSVAGVIGLTQGGAQASSPKPVLAGVDLRTQLDADFLRSGDFTAWLKQLLKATDGRKPKPGGYRPLG